MPAAPAGVAKAPARAYSTLAMPVEIIQSDRPLEDARVLRAIERLTEGNLTASGAQRRDRAAVRQTVAEAIEAVERDGTDAVIEQTARLHDVTLTPDGIRVPGDEMAGALDDFRKRDGRFIGLIERATANIRAYQEHIRIADPPELSRDGRKLAVRYTPVDRAAVYVPGGRAVYPSSVLMTVIPAQVAGVGEVVMISPPTHAGSVHPMIAAVAELLGVRTVYRVSGVAGLAAAAVGTDDIPRVDKIVGPGNAYIAEAKRQLFGRVGIDAIAGPSEVLIVADETAEPAWVAVDMLAQTEHDPGSAVLVTTSPGLAGAVAAEIDRQLDALGRADAARHGIDKYSVVIVAPDLDAAADVANAFAPEHLQIITADDEGALARIRNAGAIFVGAHTPVPVGDYYAGPSHVLPTGTTARFSGPLSCNDFLKASSVVRYDADALAADAADVADFARREGLTAHAAAVERRTEG
ncbi:MAG: histidinol dehydrogenase [Planctomycetota bacterium]